MFCRVRWRLVEAIQAGAENLESRRWYGLCRIGTSIVDLGTVMRPQKRLLLADSRRSDSPISCLSNVRCQGKQPFDLGRPKPASGNVR